MEQPVEHGGDGGGVAEELAPVVDRTVRGQEGAGALVAAHDQLEQVLGGGVGQLAHAEVVDDEQGHRRTASAMYSLRVPSRVASAISSMQGVGLAIEHAIALQDGGAADGLGEVALAGAGRAEEERVLALLDEARRWRARRSGRRFIFLLKSKSKLSSELVRVAEAGLLDASSKSRSWRRSSSSATSAETRSSGASFSVCACQQARLERRRPCRTSRSLRSARSSSIEIHGVSPWSFGR